MAVCGYVAMISMEKALYSLLSTHKAHQQARHMPSAHLAPPQLIYIATKTNVSPTN
jgi:hypothetical protein